MSHLTDEQIEQLIADPDYGNEHASQCKLCGDRFRAASALRRRLRSAFESVRANPLLEQQIIASIRAAGRKAIPRRLGLVLRRLGPGLAVAAALILVVLALTLRLGQPQQAMAATAELAQIHQANLMPHARLRGTDDPDHVAKYLQNELGFTPALPKLGVGMALRGCCVAHFRNRPVGSYVVETDRGIMSIIVLHDALVTLEFPDQTIYRGHTYHVGSFAHCEMAAIAIQGYTYAAVGETDAQWLVELLDGVLNNPRN